MEDDSVLVSRAYKTKLALKNAQVSTCRKHGGAARYAHIWGLQRQQDVYRATSRTPSAIDLHREPKARKLTNVPWVYGVVLAERWEPSSKTCSGCGWVYQDLRLANWTFRYHKPDVPCDLVLDRAANAAINLSKLAGSSSDRQNACGEASAGLGLATQVQLASPKQEPDTDCAPA